MLEFNVRFGDPETQAVLPRLESDFLELLFRSVRPGGLIGEDPEEDFPRWLGEWAVTVVLASAGYPASSSSGDPISGLDLVPDDVEVTHAGTAVGPDGTIVTAGGRVLNVTAFGRDAQSARESAYAARTNDLLRGHAATRGHRRGRRRALTGARSLADA